jgi:hypothetical protein
MHSYYFAFMPILRFPFYGLIFLMLICIFASRSTARRFTLRSTDAVLSSPWRCYHSLFSFHYITSFHYNYRRIIRRRALRYSADSFLDFFDTSFCHFSSRQHWPHFSPYFQSYFLLPRHALPLKFHDTTVNAKHWPHAKFRCSLKYRSFMYSQYT